jgi:hypothetical protein
LSALFRVLRFNGKNDGAMRDSKLQGEFRQIGKVKRKAIKIFEFLETRDVLL